MKQALLSIGIGLFLAFLLNLPMRAIERGLCRLWKKRGRPLRPRLLRSLAFLLTLFCLAGVLAAVGALVIPELLSAGADLERTAREYYDAFTTYLSAQTAGDGIIARLLLSIDLDALFEQIFGWLGLSLSSLLELALAAFSWLTTLVTALFFSLYALAGKERLLRPVERLFRALFPASFVEKLFSVARETNLTFTRFFSGQCIEAMILGVLIYIAFRIFGLPYAMVVAVLTALCALIPYIGAFFSCAVGVFLSLLESPQKALLCLIVYLSVQFIESELIYPHVVGASVGLSALWTLVAAIVGESLFGIVGMILFIPLAAVVCSLLRKLIRRKLEQKGLSAVYENEEPPEKPHRRPKKIRPASRVQNSADKD